MVSMKKIYGAVSSLFKQLEIERTFTLRIMYEHLQSILSLPTSEVVQLNIHHITLHQGYTFFSWI